MGEEGNITSCRNGEGLQQVDNVYISVGCGKGRKRKEGERERGQERKGEKEGKMGRHEGVMSKE